MALTNSVTEEAVPFDTPVRYQSVLSNFMHSLALQVNTWFENRVFMDAHILQMMGWQNIRTVKGINIFLDYPSFDVFMQDLANDPTEQPVALVMTTPNILVERPMMNSRLITITVRFDIFMPSFGRGTANTTSYDTMADGMINVSRNQPTYLIFAEALMAAISRVPYFEFPPDRFAPPTPNDMRGMIDVGSQMNYISNPDLSYVMATYSFRAMPVYKSEPVKNIDISINNTIMYSYIPGA
jgi:hypothetical protein